MRVLSWLVPVEVTRWTRATAWASLAANALLILTGGLVRLTASGLGCPTWPRCTDESWTNTPEMGLHGVIEFGNRLLTFVLVAVAVLTFAAVLRVRRRHPSLFWVALVMALGIPVQAVIGGVTVRTGLNPWVVGIHFMVSAVLIALGAVLVARARRASLPAVARAEAPGGITGPGRTRARALASVIGVSGALAIYLGTLVTGTGPHSGDAGEVVRHTFDPYWIARAHVAPVYLLVLACAAALVLAVRHRWPAPVTRVLVLLAVLLVAQAAVGYYQFFNGVPVLAVAVHMALAAVLSAVLAAVVEKTFAVSAHRPDPVAPGRHRDSVSV